MGEIQRRHEAFATRDRTAGREVFFETLGRDAEKTSNHTNFVEVPNLPDTHRERERERGREGGREEGRENEIASTKSGL